MLSSGRAGDRDAAGQWQQREVRRPRSAREGGEFKGWERMSVYETPLVASAAVRRRFNLDAASARNQTMRLQLSSKLSEPDARKPTLELPRIP